MNFKPKWLMYVLRSLSRFWTITNPGRSDNTPDCDVSYDLSGISLLLRRLANAGCMRMVAIVLIAMIGSFMFAGPSRSAELIIGTSTGYPPYYYDVDGKLKGLCVDVIEMVAKTLDINVKYEKYPWKRMLFYGKTGKVDAIMPLFKTSEREQFLYFFNNELAVEKNQFFLKKNRTVDYNGDLHSLSAYAIGAVDNYSYGKVFDGATFLKKTFAKSDQHLLELLVYNRIDLGIGSSLVILHYARLMNISDKIRFLNPPVTENSLYLGFSKAAGTIDKAKAFSAALVKIKKTPAYEDLLKRYGFK